MGQAAFYLLVFFDAGSSWQIVAVMRHDLKIQRDMAYQSKNLLFSKRKWKVFFVPARAFVIKIFHG